MAKKKTAKKTPKSREEAATGKAPAETVEGLDKDSREYHATHKKGD
jgi:hypothetical protein